jgi:cupin fold WbuC family metalloprotein
MMRMIQKSPEVFLANGPVSEIGMAEIELLREAVAKSPKRRARINAHPGSDDLLHEMLIALAGDSYIRPHKHPGKSESFHIIEGAVDIVILDEAGDIQRVVELSAKGGPGSFYYRLSAPLYHTLIIKSDLLIIHEITNGPFKAEGTVFADFAPPDTDMVAASAYMAALAARAAAFAGGTP